MMNVQETYKIAKNKLLEAGVPNAGFDAWALVKHATGQGRFDSGEVTAAQAERLMALVARRAAREPLQYLLGTWPFLDLELAVGPGVLIPRSETEEVCLAAVQLLGGLTAPAVLDLCAGSGAIALGIQSRIPDADVTALELDAEALVYLNRNVKTFAVAHARAPRVLAADALRCHDAFEPGSFDLIVSNPPYVTPGEYVALAPELYHEPRVALVAEEDGLVFYRVFAEKCGALLRHGGWLVLEIGALQGEAVAGLLRENGFEAVEVRKDMGGLDRIAVGRKLVLAHPLT